jgi:hypothetical protein
MPVSARAPRDPVAALPTGARLRVADHVRWATLNRRTVLLCLRTGAYFGLNETGTRIWQAILDGRAAADIRAELRRGTRADAARVDADCAAFTTELAQRELLIHQPTAPRRRSRDSRVGERRAHGAFAKSPMQRAAGLLPPAAHAWLCQQHVDWKLRTGGFAAAYALAARSPAGAAPSGEPLARCLAGFVAAEKFTTRLLRRDDCLPRSLALFRFLRLRGLAVRHAIGIADDPLRAHAWVELAGQPLLDDPGHVRRHTPIAVLP